MPTQRPGSYRDHAAAHATRVTGRTNERSRSRPLFMGIHRLAGEVSVDDVATAHKADPPAPGRCAVHHPRYWVDKPHRACLSLVDVPDANAAAAVHREAHGLVADQIFHVQEGA